MQPKPLFSIVIPTFNRWPYVQEAIASAVGQETGEDFEVVVVDDGSTDGTLARVRERFPPERHARLRVIRQMNSERGMARNRGAVEGAGRYLMFLDSDDVYEPWHVAAFAAAVRKNPAAPVLASLARMWDPAIEATAVLSNSQHRSIDLDTALLLGNLIPLQCLAIQRHTFERIGGFPEDRELAGSEDWIILLRLLACADVLRVPFVTVRIREHPGRSMSNPVGIIRSREAASEYLLRDGVLGERLDEQRVTKVRAGTARFRAAHLYEAGAMSEARAALGDVRRLLGWREGGALGGSLWLQTWLGAIGSRHARTIRKHLRRRASAPSSLAPGARE